MRYAKKFVKKSTSVAFVASLFANLSSIQTWLVSIYFKAKKKHTIIKRITNKEKYQALNIIEKII